MQPKDMINLLSAGNAKFGKSWAEICNEGQREQDDWIAKLKAEGVKAAHPNDGWVDRANNRITFAYPQFNDGAEVGSLIALGWPDKHKIVRLTGVFNSAFSKAWTFSEDLG